MRVNPSLPPGVQPAPSFLGAVGSALRTSLEILVAPKRAYDAIAAHATWIVPYVLIVIVDLAVSLAIEPAAAHVSALAARAIPGAEALSGFPLIEACFTSTMLPQVLWWPLTAIAFVLLVPRSDDPRTPRPPGATFSTLFALCVYGSLPQAVGNIVDATVIRFHDPAAFKTSGDLATAFPLTLAALLPGATDIERTFLAGVDVFLIWSLIVTAYGFIAIAKVRPIVALSTTFSIAAAELVLTALTAR